MGVNLSKGQNVSLTKSAPGLTRIAVGLGWDVRRTDGADFDLDGTLFLLNADGRVRSNLDFIFYNNTTSQDGAVRHQGDNTTGAGEGDDEVISIDLTRVAPDVDKIAVAVTIHEAAERRQNFGMVSKAFIRVCNEVTHEELARYDLSEDASTEGAMVFGEVYRHGNDWKFRAVGQGFSGGLGALAASYGVDV